MNKTTKDSNWNQWEEEVAHDFGKQVPGSGRTDFDKLDVDSLDFRFDCKTTESKSYSVSIKDWTKYSQQANDEGKDFGLPIRFIDPVKKIPVGLDLIVINYETFKALVENQKDN